jgi:hypothetical protein
VELSNDTLVLFHTGNHTFHSPAKNSGDLLPRQVSWYDSFPVTSRKTGARISTFSLASPSVIFCTWFPRPDGYLSLELWRYFLPPEEKISCLQLRDKLWDLDLDLQSFVTVGSRFFLLGSEPPPGACPEDAKFNICTEIVLAGDVVRHGCRLVHQSPTELFSVNFMKIV